MLLFFLKFYTGSPPPFFFFLIIKAKTLQWPARLYANYPLWSSYTHSLSHTHTHTSMASPKSIFFHSQSVSAILPSLLFPRNASYTFCWLLSLLGKTISQISLSLTLCLYSVCSNATSSMRQLLTTLLKITINPLIFQTPLCCPMFSLYIMHHPLTY